MDKVEISETHPCQRELTIQVPPEVMEEELESVYRRLGQGRRIPGFRPGKAPRSVLERYFGKEAKAEAIKNRMARSYSQTLKEKELKVVGEPTFSEVRWEGDEPFNFKVTVDIGPTVELKNYKGIRVTRENSRVDEKEISQALESLRERSASFEVVEDRPLKEGDWALVDYRELKGAQAEWVENVLLEIRSSSEEVLSGQLLGLNPGQTRTVKLKSPLSGSPDKSSVGEGEFEVRVKEIKKKIIPELNDDLARTWGGFEGLNEVKDKLRESIQKNKEAKVRGLMEDQVIAFLVNKHKFPLPPTALEHLTKDYLEELQQISKDRGEVAKEEDKADAELLKTAREKAERDLRLLFLLEEIARRENIEVDPKDIGEEVGRLAQQQGFNPVQYRQELESSGKMSILENRLHRRRVMDFLIREAKIKEVN